MKTKIHPKYMVCTVTCGCGNTFETMSTQAEVRVEICSSCHPFFTGKQKFVDTAGRVQKFEQRFNWDDSTVEKAAAARSAAQRKKEKIRKPLPKATKPKGKKVAKPADAPTETPADIAAPELPASSAPTATAPVEEAPATPAPEAATPETPVAEAPAETPAETNEEKPAAGDA